jgi:hypothetical protein
MLSLEDRMAITELIALHGHLVDDGRLDELNRVFAEDVAHDLTAFGLGIHQGLGSVREAAEALGDANPVGHHVTNVVIIEVKDDYTVVTRSKGIGIRADGRPEAWSTTIPSQNAMARGASLIARSRFVANRSGATDTGSAAKPRTIAFQPPLGNHPILRLLKKSTAYATIPSTKEGLCCERTMRRCCAIKIS